MGSISNWDSQYSQILLRLEIGFLFRNSSGLFEKVSFGRLHWKHSKFECTQATVWSGSLMDRRNWSALKKNLNSISLLLGATWSMHRWEAIETKSFDMMKCGELSNANLIRGRMDSNRERHWKASFRRFRSTQNCSNLGGFDFYPNFERYHWTVFQIKTIV